MSFWRRAPRVMVMWLGVACVLLLAAFFVAIGAAIVRVFDRAATDMVAVPDMSGGIGAIIMAVAALLPALMPFLQVFHQRHRERMDQQARGLPIDGTTPFPSPASSGAAEDIEPRPWQNSQ